MKRVPFGKGTRVLELGFGEGTFLDWAAQQGAEVAGVEMIPALCERVAARHEAIFCGALPTLLEEGKLTGPFDVIVAFDVFEHLTYDELVLYFKTFSSLLSESGKVLARFPNGQSPFGRVHQHGDITHQHSLTPFSIKQLGLMSGLVLEQAYNAARTVEGSLVKKLRWKTIYGLRDVVERMVGYLYFSAHLPLDPNLTIVMAKDPSHTS